MGPGVPVKKKIDFFCSENDLHNRACISKIPPCNIFDFVFRDCDAVSELPHSEVGAFLVDQGSIHQVLAWVNVDPPVLSQAKHLSQSNEKSNLLSGGCQCCWGFNVRDNVTFVRFLLMSGQVAR